MFLETTAPADPNQLMPGLEPEQVSPGVIGFFATFFVVVALAALILDFMRRQRRLRYRMAYAAEREAQEAQAQGESQDGADSSTNDAEAAGLSEQRPGSQGTGGENAAEPADR
ncbi:hypothetical protein [Kocuria sp.]|uniref:hypothetical protein n=1 Tax=Kocuria sp. TaxID=1871328 RepID=UPI0026DFB957|nr:hypothetical protein [Kocuria sp.]MDO5617523.1 hypothetical protein [Kocuria sp.]